MLVRASADPDTLLDDAVEEGWIPDHDVPVVDGTNECDVAWVPHRVDLEISPFHTHGSERSQARDAQRRRLLAEVGWRVIEATDEHLVSRTAFEPIITSLRRLGVDGRYLRFSIAHSIRRGPPSNLATTTRARRRSAAMSAQCLPPTLRKPRRPRHTSALQSIPAPSSRSTS